MGVEWFAKEGRCDSKFESSRSAELVVKVDVGSWHVNEGAPKGILNGW